VGEDDRLAHAVQREYVVLTTKRLENKVPTQKGVIFHASFQVKFHLSARRPYLAITPHSGLVRYELHCERIVGLKRSYVAYKVIAIIVS
jgi:hypothetical protein